MQSGGLIQKNTGSGTLQYIVDAAEDCDRDSTALDQKMDTCDSDQHAFEYSFCSYAQELIATCVVHDNCYDDAKTRRNNIVTDLNTLVPSQKAVLSTLKKVECFLLLLKEAGHNNSRIEPTDYDGCVTETHNTTNLDVNYGTLQLQDACISHSDVSDEPVTDVPGDQAWWDTEYTSVKLSGGDGGNDIHLDQVQSCNYVPQLGGQRSHVCGITERKRDDGTGTLVSDYGSCQGGLVEHEVSAWTTAAACWADVQTDLACQTDVGAMINNKNNMCMCLRKGRTCTFVRDQNSVIRFWDVTCDMTCTMVEQKYELYESGKISNQGGVHDFDSGSMTQQEMTLLECYKAVSLASECKKDFFTYDRVQSTCSCALQFQNLQSFGSAIDANSDIYEIKNNGARFEGHCANNDELNLGVKGSVDDCFAEAQHNSGCEQQNGAISHRDVNGQGTCFCLKIGSTCEPSSEQTTQTGSEFRLFDCTP